MVINIPTGGFTDKRGCLVEVVNTGRWGQVGVVRSKKNVRWGGHYHRLTTEVFYIIEGKVRFETKRLPHGKVIRRTVGLGSKVTIKPQTLHWLITLEPTVWVSVLSRAFRPQATDIYNP
jgi:dTDP-4-dehydrorhamnose 3,5-epimerase-like enzyme